MTEAEWQAASVPTPLLEFVRDKASDRQFRLYGCGRCRLFSRTNLVAVEVAERYADGLATEEERERAFHTSHERVMEAVRRPRYPDTFQHVREAEVVDCLFEPRFLFGRLISNANRDTISPEGVCDLIRDIFGNPFRPVIADPSWLTSTVVALARGIYADRAFDRMPILADALQDAGCDNDEVLNHCRGDVPHVRGCWVVDMLTGRS